MLLKGVDAWVLGSIFQPLADWLMQVTGKSNYWWAKVCLWIFLIGASAGIIQKPHADQIIYYVASGFYLLAILYLCERVDSDGDTSPVRQLIKIRPSIRVALVFLEVPVVIGCMPGLYFIGDWNFLRLAIEATAYPSAFYLMACERPKDPLPALTLAKQSVR